MGPIKTIKRIIMGLLLLIIIAGVIVYFNLNRIIRTTISTQATNSLKLQTDVGGASLSLLGGSLSISELSVASPQGYQAQHMLALGKGNVAVSYGKLRDQPVHIDTITLTKPRLVIEQANGKFNFQALMDLPPASGEPMKLIIDKLTVTDASVVIRPGIPGLDTSMKEIVVPIPMIEIKNIGSSDGAQNGAAMKEVAMMLITALTDKAGQSGNLPKQLQDMLSQSVKGVEKQLKSEIDKQLKGVDKAIKDVTDDLGKSIGLEKDKKKKKP